MRLNCNKFIFMQISCKTKLDLNANQYECTVSEKMSVITGNDRNKLQSYLLLMEYNTTNNNI